MWYVVISSWMSGSRLTSSSVLSCRERKLMNCTNVPWHWTHPNRTLLNYAHAIYTVHIPWLFHYSPVMVAWHLSDFCITIQDIQKCCRMHYISHSNNLVISVSNFNNWQLEFSNFLWHDFPSLQNRDSKFHDFLGWVATLMIHNQFNT